MSELASPQASAAELLIADADLSISPAQRREMERRLASFDQEPIRRS